jgi:ubiquinone/menaquinone biosynthesis C-methylase UbiE
MTEQDSHGPSDSYPLGRSDAETQRLIIQNQIYGPLTRQFLAGAGIGAGMKVLDLGSGAGDVALLLADLVGPQGHVVGIDANAEIVERARARVQATGWRTVTFHHGDVQQLDVGDGFDAVVGRWVLMYMPDPVNLLRQAMSCLRPGGIVAFQESDLKSGRTYPAAPLYEQVQRWMTPQSTPPGAPTPESRWV